VFHYQKTCQFGQCFGLGLAAFFGKEFEPMDALPLLAFVAEVAALWWAIDWLRR